MTVSASISPDSVPPILLENVGKSFRQGFWMRSSEVVKRVSLKVSAGSLFGYLGHNGAGKTTTIKMLLGLIEPSHGKVSVWGGNPASVGVRRRVGYLPEQPYFYDYLTAREFLAFHAELAGVPHGEQAGRIAELFDWVGLEGVGNVTLSRFSKGMQQRIGLAQALVGDPDLVILDEPMSGLDPVGRKQVRDIMLELKRRGKTVFFSTHILADAEAVCDQVAILVKGEIRCTGRLADLLAPKITEVEVVALGLPDGFAVEGVLLSRRDDGQHMRVSDASIGALLQKVLAAGGRVVSVTPHRETLEELFLNELNAVERAG
ncbi:MAG: ABC transporter ATP-binding protein [Nitrospirota bacterium]|nr:ABC transporter ATP-binding protein [Nitrospirota bacterium]